ncbi:MAG: hypothetical protein OEU46_01590 [Alphaproteobacteria bacterium]|nr:hypothetical protein [Alphaproteobacteria bacterium]
MSLFLRLIEDRFAAAESVRFAALNRVIYVDEGVIEIDGNTIADDGAWFGAGAVTVRPGPAGARLWRFELTRDRAVEPAEKLRAAIETLDPGDGQQWLMRCDSVAFPPGGCAFTHTHQGPGIRCLRDGTIRIDAEGASHAYAPGEAWFESGPDPVFAQADAAVPSRFIQVMVLPRALKGQSSIRYVLPEDADKPKTQQYRGYVDEFIEL